MISTNINEQIELLKKEEHYYQKEHELFREKERLRVLNDCLTSFKDFFKAKGFITKSDEDAIKCYVENHFMKFEFQATEEFINNPRKSQRSFLLKGATTYKITVLIDDSEDTIDIDQALNNLRQASEESKKSPEARKLIEIQRSIDYFKKYLAEGEQGPFLYEVLEKNDGDFKRLGYSKCLSDIFMALYQEGKV